METRYLYTKTKGGKYNRRFLAINTCGYHIQGINTSKTNHFSEFTQGYFFVYSRWKENGTEGIMNHAPHSNLQDKTHRVISERKYSMQHNVCVFFCECAQKELNA